MAEYMETLLAQTPLHNPIFKAQPYNPRRLNPFPIESPYEKRYGDRRHQTSSAEDLTKPDIPLADPKFVTDPSLPASEPTAPDLSKPIFIRRQEERSAGDMEYNRYLTYLNEKAVNDHRWAASQKEPLVEIPVKRTKQYFALINEMEEYSEKRAAKALDGTDGRTMSEKEEGIKLFERVLGGLRSLGGREKFQGTAPWERPMTELERRKLVKEAKNRISASSVPAVEAGTVVTPVDVFRQQNATELVPGTQDKAAERVVWRFEDVSWVKQRTARPR